MGGRDELAIMFFLKHPVSNSTCMGNKLFKLVHLLDMHDCSPERASLLST